MIADDKNALEPNNEISLGVFNSTEESLNFEFADNILQNSLKPLKSFKIVNNSYRKMDIDKSKGDKIVEFAFEKNNSTISNLSNYLDKNDINLFCINRDQKNSKDQMSSSDLNELINKLNVSILLTGRQDSKIQSSITNNIYRQ
jgi:hypothetical protein